MIARYIALFLNAYSLRFRVYTAMIFTHGIQLEF